MLIETHTGTAAKEFAILPKPFGPGFAEEVASRFEKIEVHATNYNDPGPDFCEFRAFDAQGGIVATSRMRGY